MPTEFFRAVSAAPPLLLGFSWREEFGHFLPVSRSETLEFGHLTVMNRATANSVPHFVAHFVAP